MIDLSLLMELILFDLFIINHTVECRLLPTSISGSHLGKPMVSSGSLVANIMMI